MTIIHIPSPIQAICFHTHDQAGPQLRFCRGGETSLNGADSGKIHVFAQKISKFGHLFKCVMYNSIYIFNISYCLFEQKHSYVSFFLSLFCFVGRGGFQFPKGVYTKPPKETHRLMIKVTSKQTEMKTETYLFSLSCHDENGWFMTPIRGLPVVLSNTPIRTNANGKPFG